jgi:hypothetical protein
VDLTATNQHGFKKKSTSTLDEKIGKTATNIVVKDVFF